MTSYTFVDSPLGPVLLVSDGRALTGLYFAGQKYFPPTFAGWRESARSAPFAHARRQLDEYFSGRRRIFDVPLAPDGTGFQRTVWREIARVPFGETVSYGALARRIGVPNGARAVGAATGRNPVTLLIPCHRILGAGGGLTGYAGGLDRKESLLALEADVTARGAR